MKKFKDFVKRNLKALSVSAVAAIATVISVVGCFAAETTSTDLSTFFSTGLSTISSSIMSYIAIALPVGLTIFGAIIAIKKGISFIRGLLGK